MDDVTGDESAGNIIDGNRLAVGTFNKDGSTDDMDGTGGWYRADALGGVVATFFLDTHDVVVTPYIGISVGIVCGLRDEDVHGEGNKTEDIGRRQRGGIDGKTDDGVYSSAIGKSIIANSGDR